MRILGENPEAIVSDALLHPSRREIRMFVASRSRLAEDALARAVEHEVRQLVILGAGLDTFAYRSPFKDCVQIFEVDHPATQAWKRRKLTQTQIPVPNWLTFVPVDFERETLADRLASSGFDPNEPAFFSWLGVVPYLTETAIWSTLEYVAVLPKGAYIVFDYSNPPSSLALGRRIAYYKRVIRTAWIGESFISHFETERLHDKLASLGYTCIEDLGPQQIAQRFHPKEMKSADKKGGHVLYASTIKKTPISC
jgi:methyltransferase (TIGR00027 family)